MTSLLLTLSCLSAGIHPPSSLPPYASPEFRPSEIPETSRPALTSPTPLWDAVVEHRGFCPAPAFHAFHKLPRICHVKPCECDGEPGKGFAKDAWLKEFHDAARVNFPRFALDHCPLEGDGLLIYEGMRLKVDPATGLYDVSFTASVPSMPVMLRLQLILTPPGPVVGQSYRLTLPPIRMEPPKDAKVGDISANTFHIAHRGYSSLFLKDRTVAQCAADDPKIDCTWTITRIGTARFGTAVTQEEGPR